jgi:uncharacterized UPF0146 family protein
VALQASLVKVANLVNARAVILANLNEKVTALENQQTVTQNEWAAVDAASSRIAGNEKIPPVNYGPPAPVAASAVETQLVALQASLVKVANLVNARAVILANLNEKVTALENQQTVTQNEWAAVDAEYAANRTSYNAVVVPAIAEYISARENADIRVRQVTAGDFRVLDEGILTVLERSKSLKERIRLLQFKIEGINT